MIDSADVVVIGSGAFGASVAYHLARRGARVAVLERAGLASQTSPRAAGLSSQVRATPALTKLAQRAVSKLAEFSEETGQALRFTQSGALKIARTDRDAEQLTREVRRGAEAGVPIELVTVSEARQRLPILGERGIVAVTWSPTDCNVEPSELPIGYCRAAEKLGAVLLPHTPATEFAIGPRGVEGVRTPRGVIATRVVVDAAGGWARVVAARLGGALPVIPTRHQLLITEPIPGVGPEFPIARVIDANVYVRHERGGLMLGGYESDPWQVDMSALSPAFRHRRAAPRHRGAVAPRPQRERAVSDLPGSDHPRGRASGRASHPHHGRPLPGRAAPRSARGVGDERLLRRRPQRLARARRGDGGMDSRR